MMMVFEGKTRNGVRYKVFNDCAAPRGSKAEREFEENQRRIAREILRAAAERMEDHGGYSSADGRADAAGGESCVV